MIFGNYIINAEQALETTKKAIERQEKCDKKIAFKQAEAELKYVYGAISDAANHGETSNVVWIMYNSTRDDLLKHGFRLSGGVIRENIPRDKWDMFGTTNDMVCIEWGNSSAE